MFDFLSQNVSIHQHQNMSREEGGGGVDVGGGKNVSIPQICGNDRKRKY